MKSSIVHKLLALLSDISEAQKPMTFSEIVEKTGLNKSTIHRLLAVGVDEQIIRYDSHNKVYLLGTRVFDLVRNAYNGYDIQAIALDEMTRLYDLYDANVTIGVSGGQDVVYLRILESPRSMGGVQRPGMRDPIHCSASGKALFAHYPEKALEAILKDYTFTRHTDRTIDNVDDFKKELARVRERGFGTNDREEYDHFLGISAPIFNYIGEPIAVLNVWSSFPRHTMQDLLSWTPELKASAAHLTEMIGGIDPSMNERPKG